MSLARKHGTRLHVLHISTADELALFTPGPLIAADGTRKKITAETCIHFLRFDRADYATLGNLIKCNPAIKDASDREALIEALVDDVIDVLATDHAPHTLEEKENPTCRRHPACRWCSTHWWPPWNWCTNNAWTSPASCRSSPTRPRNCST